MAYVAMATNWVYRKLITYQDLNKLGANDAYLKDKVENVSTGHIHSGAAGEGKKINFSDLTLDADWTNYGDLSVIEGWSSFTAGRKYIYYKKIGKLVFVWFHLEGTSNAVNISFRLPYTSANTGYGDYSGALGFTYDNGAAILTPGRYILNKNYDYVLCYSNMATGVWTASGTKIVEGQFWYEAA